MWMLEYTHCLAQPMGCIFYGEWNAGSRMFAYSYVYIEGNGHKILVDIGHDNRSSNKKFQRRELETSRDSLERSPLFDSLIGALDPQDIEHLEDLARQGRLTLLDGSVEDLLPGLDVIAAWDTHTKGSQYVVVTDHAQQRWVVTGDAMYSYENAEGINQSGVYVNIGFGGGSGWAGILLIDEMVKAAGGTERLVIAHESATYNRHPSRLYDDNLSVAELVLAPGEPSRITAHT
jgi:hypothetical protein